MAASKTRLTEDDLVGLNATVGMLMDVAEKLLNGEDSLEFYATTIKEWREYIYDPHGGKCPTTASAE